MTKVTISCRAVLCSSYSHPALLESGKFLSSCSIVTWLDKACCDDSNDLLKDSVRRQVVDVFLARCDKPSNSAAARDKTAHTCLGDPQNIRPLCYLVSVDAVHGFNCLLTVQMQAAAAACPYSGRSLIRIMGVPSLAICLSMPAALAGAAPPGRRGTLGRSIAAQ